MQGSNTLIVLLTLATLSGRVGGLIVHTKIADAGDMEPWLAIADAGDTKPANAGNTRPQFHFTAQKNWINDPNGLVYYDGEYHLFFQHNPHAVTWGDMTWGHAVSKDLVHWEQLEHAILPDEHGDIWSGSCVVDLHNSSGLQLPGGHPPMVAFYTNRPRQQKTSFSQRVAYSLDKGRTFTKLPTPAVDSFKEQESSSARDPKVDWHEASKQWIMVLWLHNKGKTGTFGLFSSKDLHSFEKIQEIEMQGDYECPDFFELPVAGSEGKDRKYVLMSAGGKYMVGTFDGKKFVAEGPSQHVEYGDGYAAQTYHGEPKGRRVQISWLGYPKGNTCGRKQAFAAEPFTGQMSSPMELDLVSLPQGLRLRRQPATELDALKRTTLLKYEDHAIASGKSIGANATAGAGLDILLKVEAPSYFGESAKGADLKLNVFGEELLIKMKKLLIPKLVDENSEEMFKAGLAFPEQHSLKNHRASLSTQHKQKLPIQADANGLITLRVIVDRHSIEVFDVSGGASLSMCTQASFHDTLPRFDEHQDLTVTASDSESLEPVTIKSLTVSELVA